MFALGLAAVEAGLKTGVQRWVRPAKSQGISLLPAASKEGRAFPPVVCGNAPEASEVATRERPERKIGYGGRRAFLHNGRNHDSR